MDEPRLIDVNNVIKKIRRSYLRRERGGHVFTPNEKSLIASTIIMLEKEPVYKP